MLELIDAHAHLNFEKFDADRAAVFQRAEEGGVGMINVGTDKTSSQQAVELAQGRDNVWATIGLHPTDFAEGFDSDFYFNLGQNKKVVAVGECGLDKGRSEALGISEEELKQQKKIFEQQIALATALKKPLMLHIRRAYREVIDLLIPNASSLIPTPGNVHFFAGSWDEAKLFLDLGFTLSFTGVITFARDYDEVIKKVPLDKLLVETDCPFVAPVPYRGQRNEPSYVKEVARQIALIKNLTYEEVARATLTNTRKLFNLA